MDAKPSLTLKRRLKAAPEKVYEAWTHPEQMTRWWGVTPHPNKPIAETDLRVGGRFRVQFWGESGEHHAVGGVYREIVPGRRLVFSWAWQSTPERESQVTVDLKPVDDGTMLTLTHEQFFSEKARDDHGVGWNGALNNLERLFP
ncbi:MAG: SRPBCC domain-containing protein [Alphaproteobacteria bacterium]|nr:SRPBCC domain-containing protein [Alphaproteobacteria bacterium]